MNTPLSISVLGSPEQGGTLVGVIGKALNDSGIKFETNVEGEFPTPDLSTIGETIAELNFMPVTGDIFSAMDAGEEVPSQEELSQGEQPQSVDPAALEPMWDRVSLSLGDGTKGYTYFYPEDAPEDIRGKHVVYAFDFGPVVVGSLVFALTLGDAEGFKQALDATFPSPVVMKETTYEEMSVQKSIVTGLILGRALPVGPFPGAEKLKASVDAISGEDNPADEGGSTPAGGTTSLF